VTSVLSVREEAIKLAGTAKEDMLQCFVINLEKTEGGHHQAISQKHADLIKTSVKVNAVSHGFCHDSQANDLCQEICIVAETKLLMECFSADKTAPLNSVSARAQAMAKVSQDQYMREAYPILCTLLSGLKVLEDVDDLEMQVYKKSTGVDVQRVSQFLLCHISSTLVLVSNITLNL
jgi:hypothetical protein